MDLAVVINSLVPTPVFRRERGTTLVKGGKKRHSDIWAACEEVEDRYACYYWKDSHSIRYVGSISKDYKTNGYKTNLIGRVSNYLQNHSASTNKMVFDNINKVLLSSFVEFGIFRYSSVTIDTTNHDYDDCVQRSPIIQMLEEILICHYRLQGQSDWNRT